MQNEHEPAREERESKPARKLWPVVAVPGENSVEPQFHTETPSIHGSRLLFQRHWRTLAAEIVQRPAHIPPTIVPGGSYLKFCVLLSGAIRLTIDKGGRPRQNHHFEAGTISLSVANQPDVEVEWHGESLEPVDFMYVYLDAGLLSEMAAADANLDAVRLELSNAPELEDPLIQQIVGDLVRELQQPDPQNGLYGEAVAQMLAMRLIRHHSRVHPVDSRLQYAVLSNRNLRLVKDYVREHLPTAISVQDLASLVGLSPYHFCRVFKQTTHQSPYQYVTAQRMAHATHLLQRTRLTVAHIGSLVGYQSASQFSALFKRHTGRSPGAYARRLL